VKKKPVNEFEKQILFDVDEDIHALLSALARANDISIDECAKGIILSWVSETEKQIKRDMKRAEAGKVEQLPERPLVTLK
jgi:hypothetical protein